MANRIKRHYDFSATGRFTRFFMTDFKKCDDDFLVLIRISVLSAMHGFRNNEVLFPTGHDVIVSPPPVGAARTYS